MNVTIYSPLEISTDHEEVTIETPGGFATVYIVVEPTTLESYDLAVAAEIWRNGMDGSDGEPVTTVNGIAALLGCTPTEEALARALDATLADIHLARWEARYGY